MSEQSLYSFRFSELSQSIWSSSPLTESETRSEERVPVSDVQTPKEAEVIGMCPRCYKDILEGEPTALVLGQLFHADHAPKGQSAGKP